MLRIKQTSYRTFTVIEETEEDYNEYYVFIDTDYNPNTKQLQTKIICTCPYYTRKPGRICKHIKEVIKYRKKG